MQNQNWLKWELTAHQIMRMPMSMDKMQASLSALLDRAGQELNVTDYQYLRDEIDSFYQAKYF